MSKFTVNFILSIFLVSWDSLLLIGNQSDVIEVISDVIEVISDVIEVISDVIEVISGVIVMINDVIEVISDVIDKITFINGGHRSKNLTLFGYSKKPYWSGACAY